MTVIMPDANFANSSFFIVIILLIVILQLRERKMKLRRLILMPLILSLFIIPFVFIEMYSIFNAVIIFAGLLTGVLMGILIGKFMEVKIHEDGSIIFKGSYIAVFIWIAIILMRIYGKGALGSMGIVDLNLLTSAFLIMAVGAMISRRMFIYWKYRGFRKSSILNTHNPD